jgi:hypothetical protein
MAVTGHRSIPGATASRQPSNAQRDLLPRLNVSRRHSRHSLDTFPEPRRPRLTLQSVW